MDLKTKDDPEANGRKPLIGDRRYTLTFPLESGEDLKLLVGRETMNHFAGMIAQMMLDDENDGAQRF